MPVALSQRPIKPSRKSSCEISYPLALNQIRRAVIIPFWNLGVCSQLPYKKRGPAFSWTDGLNGWIMYSRPWKSRYRATLTLTQVRKHVPKCPQKPLGNPCSHRQADCLLFPVFNNEEPLLTRLNSSKLAIVLCREMFSYVTNIHFELTWYSFKINTVAICNPHVRFTKNFFIIESKRMFLSFSACSGCITFRRREFKTLWWKKGAIVFNFSHGPIQFEQDSPNAQK